MTCERSREEADRRAEESDRRIMMHEFERDTARQSGTGPGRRDPIHVLRIHRHEDPPETREFCLARWSLIARLRRDAEGSGDTLDDLGPDALKAAQAAQSAEFLIGGMVLVGIANGDQWTRWFLPPPVEPVPGGGE